MAAMDEIINLSPQQPKSSKKGSILVVSLVALIGICVMVIAFFGLGPMLAKPVSPITTKNQDVSDVLGLNKPSEAISGAQVLTKEQTEQLLQAISQQVELPQKNSVLAYQITDISSFQSSDFFSKAVIGDIFITFEPSKMALLYSRLQGQIINQGQMSGK